MDACIKTLCLNTVLLLLNSQIIKSPHIAIEKVENKQLLFACDLKR